jgi:hypothetical protein
MSKRFEQYNLFAPETYNERAAAAAQAAGALASHDDDLPLGRPGNEGQPLGQEAQPTRPDLGRVYPDLYDRDAQEHSATSTLPESVSQGEILADCLRRGTGGGF